MSNLADNILGLGVVKRGGGGGGCHG